MEEKEGGEQVMGEESRVDLLLLLAEWGFGQRRAILSFSPKSEKVAKLVSHNNISVFGDIYAFKRFSFNKDYFCC